MNPVRIIILLWWLWFAAFAYVSIFVSSPLGPDLWGMACLHARLFIPMRTKGMHVATIVLFLAAGLCALQASNFPWLGLLAMLGLAAFVILILVSDILQLVRKPQAAQE